MDKKLCDKMKSDLMEDKTLWKFKEPIIKDVLAAVKEISASKINNSSSSSNNNNNNNNSSSSGDKA